MRRVSGITLAVMLFTVGCLAQDFKDDDYFTKGVPNGLAWKIMGSGEKTMFVLAFQLAIGQTTAMLKGTSCPGATLGGPVKSRDLMHEVDAFYSTVANVPIPLNGAVTYGLLKLNGATQEELDQFRSAVLGSLSK